MQSRVISTTALPRTCMQALPVTSITSASIYTNTHVPHPCVTLRVHACSCTCQHACTPCCCCCCPPFPACFPHPTWLRTNDSRKKPIMGLMSMPPRDGMMPLHMHGDRAASPRSTRACAARSCAAGGYHKTWGHRQDSNTQHAKALRSEGKSSMSMNYASTNYMKSACWRTMRLHS